MRWMAPDTAPRFDRSGAVDAAPCPAMAPVIPVRPTAIPVAAALQTSTVRGTMREFPHSRNRSQTCKRDCGIVLFRSMRGGIAPKQDWALGQTHAPSTSIRARGWGLPIGVWLILGFAFVIGAFVTANILAQRSTRLATADVARVQQEFEPLARHARDLGAAVAAFDRAVLAYLRSSSSENGSKIVESGTRLSDVVNRAAELPQVGDDAAFPRDRRPDGRAPGRRLPARRPRGAPADHAPGARCRAERARRAGEQRRRQGRARSATR